MPVVKFPQEIGFNTFQGKKIIKKSEKVVESQIAINKINLPDELLHIIKDYIYISIYECAKKNMTKYVNLDIKGMIMISRHGYTIMGESIRYHLGRALHNRSCIERELIFDICSKCGNYIMISRDDPVNIHTSALCKCYGNISMTDVCMLTYDLTGYTVDERDNRSICSVEDTRWIGDSYESDEENYKWSYGDNGIDWD
jgi:hypothetical protein